MNQTPDFSKIPALQSLGPWDSAAWVKSADKVSCFKTSREGQSQILVTAYLISGTDDEIWTGCQSMLANALRMTTVGLLGFYGFEMVAMELGRGIEHFRFQDLTQLLVNHSRTMNPGDTRLIQYGGLFGVFKKRVAEDWGKLDFKFCVQVELRPKDRLDLVLKGLLREGAALAGSALPVSLVLCDLSAEPLYDAADEHQALRLLAWYQKLDQDKSSPFIDVIYRHQGKNLKLWSLKTKETCEK